MTEEMWLYTRVVEKSRVKHMKNETILRIKETKMT